MESFAPLHEMTEQEFDRIVSVNLRGTWLVYKHAVPALADGGGAIVNIASLAGVVGFPLLGAYSASKAGIVRMTEVMALEQHVARAPDPLQPRSGPPAEPGRRWGTFEAELSGVEIYGRDGPQHVFSADAPFRLLARYRVY